MSQLILNEFGQMIPHLILMRFTFDWWEYKFLEWAEGEKTAMVISIKRITDVCVYNTYIEFSLLCYLLKFHIRFIKIFNILYWFSVFCTIFEILFTDKDNGSMNGQLHKKKVPINDSENIQEFISYLKIIDRPGLENVDRFLTAKAVSETDLVRKIWILKIYIRFYLILSRIKFWQYILSFSAPLF